MITYKQWLAECLGKDEDEITGLEMDADSRAIYDNLYSEYHFMMMIEDDAQACRTAFD